MQGSGTTPIVFVHGSPGGWASWARFLDAPALGAFGTRMAIDGALHDWIGKRLGQPTWRLLGLEPTSPPTSTAGRAPSGRNIARARG